MNYRGASRRHPEGDRIVILEDTTGTGRADKSTVFVQESGLAAPLGVAVFDNKIVVSQPPDLLVYTDVNRDGKFEAGVDKREVLLTGFNGRQHDHSLHSEHGAGRTWYWNQGNTGALFTDKSGRTFRMGSRTRIPTARRCPPTSAVAGKKSDDGHA